MTDDDAEMHVVMEWDIYLRVHSCRVVIIKIS